MPNYTKTIRSLSQKLKPASEAQNIDAAVALLLEPADQGLNILLVKRTERPLDPWSGQMAFPGGKRDPKDRDIIQTVVRETLEETNINIANRCRFLGVLEHTRSTVRPKLLVASFVILLEHEPTIILSEELEGYVWALVKKLRECRGTADFPFGEVPAYFVEGNVVWGLTFRILEKFTQIFEHIT
ncbi:MAG: CoA pyrophosphatase [Candidatus Bathyarchaeota archaeon]|nr:CoA pyrophosphatase [Candidatus Bathyarchaeota archaeon]